LAACVENRQSGAVASHWPGIKSRKYEIFYKKLLIFAENSAKRDSRLVEQAFSLIKAGISRCRVNLLSGERFLRILQFLRRVLPVQCV